MRVLPLMMATAWLAPVARIAVMAIDEEMALWLAVALALGFGVWPALVAKRLRRRYRARLDQLRDPIAGALPAAESPLPLPAGVRLWLIAVPVLVVAALWFAVRAPGAGNTCVSDGIATAAAREGICQRGANLFGGGVTYNVVDAGHVLHMPDYDAKLLATSSRITPVSNAAQSPTFYPDGTGTLVCFQLAITNRGSAALAYDAGGSDVGLLLQSPPSPEGPSYFFDDLPDANGEPGPSLGAMSPIQPGQTAIGWVAFVAPQWALETLNARATDLQFLRPTSHGMDSPGAGYIGQIRLWKAANASGTQALANRPTA